jgi:uncharacterized protein YlxW (UPF0749 family)
VAVIALIVGFLIAASWAEARDAERAARPERERLAGLIASRQAQTGDLEKRLADLRKRLDATAGASGRLDDLRAEAARLAGDAGRAGLRGQGLVVELRDAASAEGEDAADERVQDVDLQLVVNTLWSAGAEAIAINGERIVSTTAIRSAGSAILVNFRVLTTPYRVVTLGDAAALERRFGASEIATRFRRWAEIYGLGMSIKRDRKLSVPAYAGAVRSRYAVPVS